jgi:hypothetical protein
MKICCDFHFGRIPTHYNDHTIHLQPTLDCSIPTLLWWNLQLAYLAMTGTSTGTGHCFVLTRRSAPSTPSPTWSPDLLVHQYCSSHQLATPFTKRKTFSLTSGCSPATRILPNRWVCRHRCDSALDPTQWKPKIPSAAVLLPNVDLSSPNKKVGIYCSPKNTSAIADSPGSASTFCLPCVSPLPSTGLSD